MPSPARTAAQIIALLVAASGAVAQDQGALQNAAPVAAEKDKHAAEFEVNLFGSYTFSADFSDAPGSVGVSRTGAEVTMRKPLGDRSRLNVSLAAELSFYDFENATGLGSSEPWGDTTEVSLSAVFARQATDKWSFFFGGGVDASFENDADIGKSFTGGVVAGVNYKVSDTFTFGGGLILRSQLEDSGTFLPVINFDWKLAEKVRLSTATQLNSYGVALAYQATDKLSLSLHGAYESRAYRLSDTGPIIDGVARDGRIPVWVQARYEFSPRASVTLSGGYVAWQQLTVDDANGVELNKLDVNGAPFVGASVDFVF